MNKYFLTVDWCNQGKRGIFASLDGGSFWKEEANGEHTEDEMYQILGIFDLILSPKSTLISEEELKEYRYLTPLDEYSGQYGIVRKETVNE
jgi:hypothetical protein